MTKITIPTYAATYLCVDVLEGLEDDAEPGPALIARYLTAGRTCTIAMPPTAAEREAMWRALTDAANACDEVISTAAFVDGEEQGMTRAQWRAACEGLGTAAGKFLRAAVPA